MIAISACLAGVKCRYNGTAALSSGIQECLKNISVLEFCPELLGGLTIPRKPAEISGGDGVTVLQRRARVLDSEGVDLTHSFLRGAEAAMHQLMAHKIRAVVLKDKSPSCGVGCIYDGTFSKRLTQGCGVTTAVLLTYQIVVFNENENVRLNDWIQQQGKGVE